jgi:hypothetical protein
MGQKIVVGPINKGLKTDRLPFVINNDSFPTLINAYQWRGRIKRKRGTSFLTRLTRFFKSTSTSYSSTSTINLVAGAANILTGFGLETNGNIVLGSITIVDTTAGKTYTDPSMDGTLIGAPSGTGTVNYASGAITISAGAADTINATFRYTPDLPVMGLEELRLLINQPEATIAFDDVYSYIIKQTFPYNSYDVSFYKNPSSGSFPGYVQKINVTPTWWNGKDYQQFWTVNYLGALWATNGITTPFTVTNIGMQFKNITGVTIGAVGPPALANLTIVSHGLVVGDFIFVNEVGGITGINFQTGYVTVVVNANTVTVEFPNATLGGAYTTGGIAQYLTNRSNNTLDGIRFYDGDPTDGNATTPTLSGTKGWVNFAPPLSKSIYSIADLPSRQYYLVGCKMILPFKDRLVFFAPVIQASSGDPIFLQDAIVYSQNGTPYYTASFTGDGSLPTTTFNAILVPSNQTATANAYWEDQTGFGGSISAGVDQTINTASSNEDVIIVGFDRLQTRLVATGNDIVPFIFYLINSELGSTSTFSAINMDGGIFTKGARGYIATNQETTKRIDLEIPDQVFEASLINNGPERVCAQRDYINEWIYFTYPNDAVTYKFPNQTLQYNYREDTWAIFNEAYTTYGSFRKQQDSSFTWATVGNIYSSWNKWNVPWDFGSSQLLEPEVIAGNQQGFVIVRDEGTNESNSLYIQNITSTTITSPDHTLNEGDYITISGVLGTIGTQVNGKIFSVATTTQNTFILNPSITTGTYLGGGLIQRMYVPFIQTKQFPVAWEMSKKTRLGVQQYLLTTTALAQIQLLIYLSQNDESPYNDAGIVPAFSVNNSLIYSTVLYTCPESTNLGLTAANINLNMVTAQQQQQTWHRINTSLIGDTVQLGFTLSDTQMRAVDDSGNPISQFAEIEIHGFILDVTPSMVLA